MAIKQDPAAELGKQIAEVSQRLEMVAALDDAGADYSAHLNAEWLNGRDRQHCLVMQLSHVGPTSVGGAAAQVAAAASLMRHQREFELSEAEQAEHIRAVERLLYSALGELSEHVEDERLRVGLDVLAPQYLNPNLSYEGRCAILQREAETERRSFDQAKATNASPLAA